MIDPASRRAGTRYDWSVYKACAEQFAAAHVALAIADRRRQRWPASKCHYIEQACNFTQGETHERDTHQVQ